MPPSSYPDARRAGPAGDGSGVSSPSRTKPNPPAMPCQGVPGLALPRLPLPLARPDPRGTSLWCNGPLNRSVPGPVRSGKARRAFVRNGKAQDIRERGQVPGPLPAGCLLTDGDTQVSAAPPPSRCVASKASGRGPLLPFPRPCVAHQLAEPQGCQAQGPDPEIHGSGIVGRARDCGQLSEFKILSITSAPVVMTGRSSWR